MKDYFTIPEAAKLCSVNRTTMLRWAKSGKIKSYSTPGGHKRILNGDLKEWFESNGLPFDIKKFQKNKTKILIVDDDSSVRYYLKKILGGVLIDLCEATDGFDAGKKLIQFDPDLIILDLFMPNMDGFKLCENIKNDESTKKIKILILSGQGTKENRHKALSLGADAFLDKPSDKKEIIDCVEMLLQSR